MSNVYDADDEITNINNEYADVKVAYEISAKLILFFLKKYFTFKTMSLWGQVVLATANKCGSSSCISSKAILYNFKWEIPLVQVFLQKLF